MKKVMAGIIIISCAFILVACGNGSKDAGVVGTWKSVEHWLSNERAEYLEGRTISFKDDGTAQTALGSGTFVVEDDIVLFTRDGYEGPCVTYNIDGDKLIVETITAKIVYEKAE